MQPITTKFTKLLNVRTPIVSAPMAYAATGKMAAAATSVGGFGFIGAGMDTSVQLKAELQSIRTSLGLQANVPVPAGVGFLGWVLDITEATDDQRIPSVLEEMPVALWFSFGKKDLGSYIAQVRAYDAKRDHKTIIFVIVNSVEEAKKAVDEWKVDVLVAQGFEAGGHGSATAVPLFSLLQAMLLAFPPTSDESPPILAAGGVTTGAQVASLLTLGASGVVLGTRLLATQECSYTPGQKSAILDAGLNSTTRSIAFDEARGPNLWPEGVDGRGVINNLMTDYEAGVELEERRKRLRIGIEKEDKDSLLVWAGIGAALITKTEATADVVREVHEEAVATLKAASSLLSTL